MAFQNGGTKNNYEEKDMNTTGVQLFNSENSFDPSMLSLNYWNKTTQIKINPVSADKGANGPKFDKDTFGLVSLAVVKVQALHKAIVEQLLPTMVSDPNKVTEVGIKNGDKYIGVGNGIKYTGEIRPYVVIYDIDKETGRATSEICYEFQAHDYIINFDNATGTCEMARRFAELEIFIIFLEESIKASTNAQVHAYRNVHKNSMEREQDNMKKVMTALNIPIEEKAGNAGRSNLSGRQAGGGFNSNRSSNVSNAPVSDANSFDDIEKELGAMH